jgi:hypothetical protein
MSNMPEKEQTPIIIETDEPVVIVQPQKLPLPEDDQEERKAL